MANRIAVPFLRPLYARENFYVIFLLITKQKSQSDFSIGFLLFKTTIYIVFKPCAKTYMPSLPELPDIL